MKFPHCVIIRDFTSYSDPILNSPISGAAVTKNFAWRLKCLIDVITGFNVNFWKTCQKLILNRKVSLKFWEIHGKMYLPKEKHKTLYFPYLLRRRYNQCCQLWNYIEEVGNTATTNVICCLQGFHVI